MPLHTVSAPVSETMHERNTKSFSQVILQDGITESDIDRSVLLRDNGSLELTKTG